MPDEASSLTSFQSMLWALEATKIRNEQNKPDIRTTSHLCVYNSCIGAVIISAPLGLSNDSMAIIVPEPSDLGLGRAICAAPLTRSLLRIFSKAPKTEASVAPMRSVGACRCGWGPACAPRGRIRIDQTGRPLDSNRPKRGGSGCKPLQRRMALSRVGRGLRRQGALAP